MTKLLVLLLPLIVTTAFADHYKTRIITASSTEAQRTIEVGEGQSLRVADFVKDDDGGDATQYFIQVTKDSVTARVLLAGDETNAQARDAVVIAGPATVVVTAVTDPDTKLFLTFRRRGNDHGDP